MFGLLGVLGFEFMIYGLRVWSSAEDCRKAMKSPPSRDIVSPAASDLAPLFGKVQQYERLRSKFGLMVLLTHELESVSLALSRSLALFFLPSISISLSLPLHLSPRADSFADDGRIPATFRSPELPQASANPSVSWSEQRSKRPTSTVEDRLRHRDA